MESASKVPTKSEWLTKSAVPYKKRSSELKKIDGALEKYNQAKVEPKSYAARYKLSEELLAKIRDWKGAKNTGTKLESKRIDVVNELSKSVEQERAELVRLEYMSSDPASIAVYSMGAVIEKDGSFGGDVKEEYDTLKEEYKGINLDDENREIKIRLKLLEDQLAIANAHRLEQAQDVYGLFTAPEWFFKQPGKLFSENGKIKIEESLKKLSADYENMIIVPGTILWETMGKEGLEVRATSPVFMNGRLVHETHKKNMLGDEDGYEKKAFEQAWQRARASHGDKSDDTIEDLTLLSVSDDSSFFKIGERIVALEICGDHGRARKELKLVNTPEGSVANEAKVEKADLQVIVANGGRFDENSSVIKPGGIVIYNDSSPKMEKAGGVQRVYPDGKLKDAHKLHPKSEPTDDETELQKKLRKLYKGTYPLTGRG